MTPQGLETVFFSDSGSVSIEVAVKMALQYWLSQGQPEKHRLIALRNGYHGDTFGAMATCDPVNGMHHLFSKVLPKHLFADAPAVGYHDDWEQFYYTKQCKFYLSLCSTLQMLKVIKFINVFVPKMALATSVPHSTRRRDDGPSLRATSRPRRSSR